MPPTIPLIVAAVVMLAALFAFALARVSARADRDARRAHQEHMLMRYTGGGRPCIRCGKPTEYSLKGKPIHPECREDVA